MAVHATTPDDLDGLLEDATVVGEPGLLRALFDESALLVDPGGGEARGVEAIVRAFGDQRRRIYVSGETRVFRSGDLALVVGVDRVHVLRRGAGRAWRAAITLLDHRPNGGTR
jgi:hypothetical protein